MANTVISALSNGGYYLTVSRELLRTDGPIPRKALKKARVGFRRTSQDKLLAKSRDQ